ncbi:hypothetical protein SIN8267_00094 [Sinobacterium norvegicum]|uniref:AB hydrolase-1 domain-containing protein n=1 Tax=Sinobacterium norvegicum TaxID=1641715 RepID=A0ABM9AAN0_9GAMM|nr:alpha/beta hydrolase [Sinobacterium norvegicum]CAH0990012.1 hypothetical protein SIN8267_00094 [Sinobacterium norvegicum]
MLKKILLSLAILIAVFTGLIIYALQDNPARATIGEARYADHNGFQLQYFVSGDDRAGTVILQASYARSGSDFNELVGDLNKAGYRTLIMQARGIDGSELPSLQATLFDYADDLAVILEQEQLTQPMTLIGHAYGNRVARAFASRYPQQAKSLVLLAAGDDAPPPETRNAIFKILLNVVPDSSRIEALELAFFAPMNPPVDYWIRGWYPKAGLAQGNATATTPAEQWIDGGSASILILQPRFDAAAAEGAAKLKRLHPERVTVVELDTAGHAILPEQPDEVSRLVLGHLAKYQTTVISQSTQSQQ